MARGKLRLYLGAAPGVGKTYAMLERGLAPQGARHRRGDRLGRRSTGGPRPTPRSATCRSSPAGPSSTGARPSRRWTSPACWRAGPSWSWSTSWPTPTSRGRRTPSAGRTCDDLLDAGINVISTVNLQHLESLNDVVERITGVAQQETVPGPGGAGRRPDRAGRHGPRGAAPAAGPRQRLPARAHRRRPRQLLPRRATSPPCASWPCCGWPTGSTRSSTTTGSATTSPGRGRPRSGSWSR